MARWTSADAAQVLGETLYGEDRELCGAVIDSREVRGGEIFFALKGEKADGHDFIPQAWERGAVLAVGDKKNLRAEKLKESIPPGKGLILVNSVLDALHSLAAAWRRQIGAKVVAVTGSNGKTTTKDMIGAVLSRRFNVHKSKENFNNELGLPLTVLNAPENTEVLVLEMGMRGLGQIEYLCRTAQPDIGVITNIGRTHLELLGSEENIARAKWELIESLGSQGTAILNADDYWSVRKAKEERRDGRTVFYGIHGKYIQPDVQGSALRPAGVRGTVFDVRWQRQRATVDLPLPGEHNVLDALAALAVGVSLGMALEEGARGFAHLELSKMRLEIKPGIYGSTLISDVYNANPDSMKASLRVLKDRGSDKTLAILGEMYELGAAERSGHREVGEEVARLGIARLIAVGELGKEIAAGARAQGMNPEHIYVCATREEAIRQARAILSDFQGGSWVLLKGSRGMKMEEVTEGLLK